MKPIDFLMEITEIPDIVGRKKIFGPILYGKISVGDKVRIVHIIEKVNLRGYEFNLTIEHIESFSKKILTAHKGDYIGLLLSGEKEYKIKQGMYILAGEGEIQLDKLLSNNHFIK